MSNSNPQFATTQWTLVWKAAEEDSKHGRPALAEVIRRYWQPLYTFARKRGLGRQDAEDATQEFLSAVISGRLLEEADPAKGKFRSYLLTAWKRFLVDEYRKGRTLRRGGQAHVVSLDVQAGEQRWLELNSREPDPDRVFMRSWASSLFEEVHERLARDYSSNKRENVLQALLPSLTRNMDMAAYSELAEQLSLSPSAVKVALHRLRQRFGNYLREVVAETVEDPAEIDAELTELLDVLSR